MRIDPKTASKLDRAGVRFTLAILDEESRRHPRNAEAIAELANLLTRAGRFEEGLALDLRLAALHPGSPVVFYNLSCTYSLLGRLDDAFAALRRAIELGFDDRELLLGDDDLAAVRADPRFAEVAARLPRLPSSR